ncbi:MAG TPA: hypothetical protein VEP90_14910 [Methylomirabilota bacterium]|nr:hypothetical protein [Methylomirabilota bacterium]
MKWQIISGWMEHVDMPLDFYQKHIFTMRQRKVLDDNEWAGWLQWLKNAFHRGT